MPQDPILSISQRKRNATLPAYSLHLDLIRGLAALMVLAGHLRLIVTGHTGDATPGRAADLMSHPANATGLGHAAVVVFFVLSGYLVGGSVVRDIARDAFSWSRYGFRRLARLWTVLVPTLVLGTVIDAISLHVYSATRVVSAGAFTRGRQVMPGTLQFLGNLGFLQSVHRAGISSLGTNDALWSLSNEFWYYALFPLLAVSIFGKRVSRHLRVTLFLLAAFLLWFVGSRITAYFPLWLCGVAAYLVPAKIPAQFQKPATTILTAQFLAMLIVMRTYPLTALKADTLIAVSFTALLYAILHQVGPASASLYSRLAHVLSFPSYSLYANHIPICILLAAVCETAFPGLFRHTALASAILAGFVLAYGGLFYFLFERNTDKVRRFAEGHLPRSKPSVQSNKGASCQTT